MNAALLFSVFVIASCGLVYELVAGALASYLVGDSITQFSTVIGVYLFAMGVGSWVSRFIDRGVVRRFIEVEVMVGLVGGFSAAILFVIFAWLSGPFKPALYGLVSVTGILVGLEIPLVMRILRQHYAFKDVVSHVLSVDYLGALAVSLAFPLILAPRLGLIRTALMFGLMNVAVAGWASWLFRDQLSRPGALRLQCTLAALALAVGLVSADRLTRWAEENIYADDIVFAETTPYQRIVLTRWKDDLRLFLNGNLQFSSRDEYRYHEALVHPGLAALPGARKVLVLGGGDGLALREILKYPQIESITLVDLDARMTELFSKRPFLSELNAGSLNSPKVKVINDDALVWLENHRDFYDFIVVDFPDPTNYALGKLYTNAFYRLLEKRLSARGLMVIQATSPLFARRSFWCVEQTLRSVGLEPAPYHALVPSFGEWGYILAGRERYIPPSRYPDGLRFVDPQTAASLFAFPPDMQALPAEVNRLDNQILVRYHEEEWSRQGP
ncbi:MAG: polyamine aminopropyltransferase [Methylococcaceae bacterium]|nr:polyamine aminopropyltransferase [Methylococcaceae bacterium]